MVDGVASSQKRCSRRRAGRLSVILREANAISSKLVKHGRRDGGGFTAMVRKRVSCIPADVRKTDVAAANNKQDNG